MIFADKCPKCTSTPKAQPSLGTVKTSRRFVDSSTARTLHPAALETSGLYIHLFPVLLFPLNHISMTGSILSTVAVTLERFVATHRPIYYNTVVKDATGHARLH